MRYELNILGVNVNIIYISIFLLPVIVEFTNGIVTDGFIRKIALGTLSVGGLLALAGKGTSFICIGITLIYAEKLIFHIIKKHRLEKQGYFEWSRKNLLFKINKGCILCVAVFSY